MGVMQNVPHLLASISAFVYIGTLGCGRETGRQCKDCRIWRSRIKPITKKKGLELEDKTFLHKLFAKMVPIDCEYSQSSVLFNHEQSCGLYRKTTPVANHKRLST